MDINEIQEVRMGNQVIVARPGYYISIDNDRAIEYSLKNLGERTKELWLGPGAFIVYKES